MVNKNSPWYMEENFNVEVEDTKEPNMTIYFNNFEEFDRFREMNLSMKDDKYFDFLYKEVTSDIGKVNLGVLKILDIFDEKLDEVQYDEEIPSGYFRIEKPKEKIS